MAYVFVSSTFNDLKECREKVMLNLRRMGHQYLAMEDFVAEDKIPVDKCLEDVASCDLYVGIFAWRYGYVPDRYDKSITELEYRKAVETGKDCLIFLLDEDAPWPSKFVDKGKDAEKIAALRNESYPKRIVSFFKSADELAGLVGAAVHKWETQSRNSVPETSHRAPIQVPLLTENFVIPPKKEEIKNHLLNGDSSSIESSLKSRTLLNNCVLFYATFHC
jgi:hypothetical protein